MRRIIYGMLAAGTSLLMAVGLPLAARAAGTQVVVTPSDTHGWSTSDTRPGGTVGYSMDTSSNGSPHNGALQLSTDISTTSKAQYMHEANTPLANVSELSYQTKQISASIPEGDASYQLPVCLGGFTSPKTATNPSGCTGFTTFVYEPYQNGSVTPGTWQIWDVAAGQFWSTRDYSSGSCTVVAGGGGAPFYTLAGLKTACPNAVVVGFGVNIGSNNPDYNVEADLVNFNGTTYNFEPFTSPSNKDQCKDNGWMTMSDTEGGSFKNQGQCVSWTQHNVNGNGQGNTQNQGQNSSF